MKAFKSALINIRRTPYQSLVAILLIAVTFFVSYTFSLTVLGSDAVIRHFESRPKVIAFFEIDSTPSQVEALATKVQQQPYIDQVKVVSKQEALEIYQKDNQENPLLLELVTADILPASIEVSATSPEHLPQIEQDLIQANGVEDVVYQESIIEQLTNWTKSLRLVGLASTVILGLISFFTIMIIIGFKISNKRRSIFILKVIGATPGYIVLPFMFEGFIYSLLGSVVGWGLMYGGLLYITPWLKFFLGNIIAFPLPWQLFVIQLGIGTGVGFFLSGFASLIAARRLINR